MPRPLTKIAPVLELRPSGVWYANWYDPVTRRTHRVSLWTRDQGTASARLVDAKYSPKARKRGKTQAYALLAEATERSRLSAARRLCKRARENAKAKRRVYDLAPEDVAQMFLDQRFRCAITNIEFRITGNKRCPWAASLDQIQPGAGYTRDNVRLVLMLVNTAMNGWGPGPVLEMVGLIASRTGIRTSL